MRSGGVRPPRISAHFIAVYVLACARLCTFFGAVVSVTLCAAGYWVFVVVRTASWTCFWFFSSSCLSLACLSFALFLHSSWGLARLVYVQIYLSIYICCVRIFSFALLFCYCCGTSGLFCVCLFVSFVCVRAQVVIVSHTWLANGNFAKTSTRVYDLSPIDLSGVQCGVWPVASFVPSPPPPPPFFVVVVVGPLAAHTLSSARAPCAWLSV